MMGICNGLIHINVIEEELVKVELLGEVVTGKGSEYEGPYEVTPSEEEQTLFTGNKFLSENVIVHKIPNNYGKITWDGVSLKIS